MGVITLNPPPDFIKLNLKLPGMAEAISSVSRYIAIATSCGKSRPR